MVHAGPYPALIRFLSGTPVLGSTATICVTPRGREAGEIPAQSRYGERPSSGASPVADLTVHARTFVRKVGRIVRSSGWTPPSNVDLEARGFAFRRDPSVRPDPDRRSPTVSPLSGSARGGASVARLVAPLLVALLMLAACTGASPSVAPSASSLALASPTTAATANQVAAAEPTPTAAPTGTPAFPHSVIDDEGNSFVLKAEPRKIVSLTPATTEILFALGAGPRVVATTDFDDYPPAAVALPNVASYTSVDVEKIVGMGADLVIAGGNFFNPPEALARLRGLGIPVIVVYATNVAGVLRDIGLIGAAVGLPDAAATMTATMQAGFDAVSATTAGLPKPRTFYELDTSTGPIYTVADGSFSEEMIRLAGGDPITTGSTTDFAIPLEKLITADPELILLGDAAYGVTVDQVRTRPGWTVMTAVKAGAIRPVDDVLVTRPGPRLVEGLRKLALAIHPDLVLPSVAPIPPVP
jgi:iron complex transport system substrate-binding protein